MNSALAVTQTGLIDCFRADRLNVYVYASRQQTGAAAAAVVATDLRRLIAAQGRAIGIFTAAPSQEEFLAELVKAEGLEWTRVVGFHSVEYLGMNEDAPPSRRKFLLDRLVRRVPMAEFHGLRGEAANPEAVCANYAALLKSRPPDFAILDISESFIASPVCGPDDAAVRLIELGEVYRQEQIRGGTFARIDEVPRRVLSLTIPTMMACPRLFAIGAGARQQAAVRAALTGELTSAQPSAILRAHPDAHLFLDQEAAWKLSPPPLT